MAELGGDSFPLSNSQLWAAPEICQLLSAGGQPVQARLASRLRSSLSACVSRPVTSHDEGPPTFLHVPVTSLFAMGTLRVFRTSCLSSVRCWSG